jgi:hypothetical protein
MNFWRKGVGLEWIFVIARSLELQALPYALNRPPRAAASAHALDGGIPFLLHTDRYCPAASDEHRSATKESTWQDVCQYAC